MGWQSYWGDMNNSCRQGRVEAFCGCLMYCEAPDRMLVMIYRYPEPVFSMNY